MSGLYNKEFSTKDQAAYWLGALFDGEGHIPKKGSWFLQITNTEYNIIELAKRLLLTFFNIESNIFEREQTFSEITGKPHKIRWDLYINGYEAVAKFGKEIPVYIGYKRNAFTNVIDRCNAMDKLKDEMIDFYNHNGTYSETARKFGVDRGTIKRAVIKKDPNHLNKLNEAKAEYRNEIVKTYMETGSYPITAKMHGLARATVMYHVRKFRETL